VWPSLRHKSYKAFKFWKSNMSWLLHYDEKKRNTIYPKNYCKRGIHCNVQCLNCTLKVWISCQVLPTICCSILYHAVFRSFQQQLDIRYDMLIVNLMVKSSQ
jgi:hypothetical protein